MFGGYGFGAIYFGEVKIIVRFSMTGMMPDVYWNHRQQIIKGF
jgi:hypothetical protein